MDLLMSSGDWWGEAERCRLEALKAPASVVPVANLANALWLADDPWAALAYAERAVALDPSHPVAWRGLGNVLLDLGRFDRAVEAYRRSLALADDPSTAFNLSKPLLGLKQYKECYAAAERRLELPECTTHRPGSCWLGWPDVGRLHLWSEQGFGDVIQHLRWLVPLLQEGYSIELELPPSMVSLAVEGLAWLGDGLTVLELGSHGFVGDCEGPLLSLPHCMGGAPLAQVFANGLGYLRLPRAAKPASRLGRQPRVGLVWASGRFLDNHSQEREYRRKSLLGSHLQRALNGLAQRPLELEALQFGEDRMPPEWIGDFAAVLPDGADFAALAERMVGLDLVISVDTAAAHLAGALGLQVWMLLPWAADSRWLRNRSDSPWYPSMRLIRQPNHSDWNGLIQRLLARLDLWLLDWPHETQAPGFGTTCRSSPGIG